MDVSETALQRGVLAERAECACARTLGARPTRTCIAELERSRTGSTQRSETPGCTGHMIAGGETQLALEQLAAFKLMARWVDQAEIESV